MYMPSPIALVLTLLASAHSPVIADLADKLGDLTGYVIIAEERIDEFEGCEHGKIVQFESGGFVTCNEYGYQYSYYADVVILAKTFTHGKQRVFLCRMVVEDEIYDVACERYMRQRVAMLNLFCEQAKGDVRTYCEDQVKLFEGMGIRR